MIEKAFIKEVIEKIKEMKIEYSHGESEVVDEWNEKEEVGEIFLNLMYEYFGGDVFDVDPEECELDR